LLPVSRSLNFVHCQGLNIPLEFSRQKESIF